MSISVGSAAEGGPEMGFWPIAVFIFVFADFNRLFDYLLILFLSFGGAVTYVLIRNAKMVFQAAKSRKNVRTGVRREGTFSDKLELFRAMVEEGVGFFPSHPLMKGAAMIAFSGNIFFGFWFFFGLGFKLMTSPSPPAVVIGFFLLPLLYLMVVVSVFLW